MGQDIQRADYKTLLTDVKQQIECARQRAFTTVNTQMLSLYFQVGKTIHRRQQEQGWGAKVITAKRFYIS